MKLKVFALLIVVPFLLNGCDDESKSKNSDTQVAAKVNGEEITVHELNQVLGSVRIRVAEDNHQEIKQKALDGLVDQVLVVQAAKNAKLDRSPEILSALEAAKRKVLVDAYIKRTLKGVGKPTDSEVEGYYNSRPNIFSQRKLFVYTQMTIAGTSEQLDVLIEKVKGVEKINELIEKLDADEVPYKKTSEIRGAEKVPAPLLKPLVSLKVGDIGYLKMSDGLLVIGLEQVFSQPVSLEQAKSAIERQLYVQNQKESAAKLVESLKEVAQVEYLGEFAEVMDSK